MRALRRARSLLHASRNALLLVLAQRFLRIELPAALLTLEDFHRVPPWSRAEVGAPGSTGVRRCYLVFGAGPLSFSASSTVTLSPFFTFWSAADGK